MRIKRNKKEAAKSEELRNIATTKRLTQVAATERKQDGDRREGHLKDTMRRLAGDVSTRKELGTDAKNVASASKAASELKKTKNISKTKAAPMMKQPSKGVKQKKSCVAQGLRKVPKASDEHMGANTVVCVILLFYTRTISQCMSRSTAGYIKSHARAVQKRKMKWETETG